MTSTMTSPVTSSVASSVTSSVTSAVTSAVTTAGTDQSVKDVHLAFAIVTLIYVPFIVTQNTLVLASAIVFRKLHTPHNMMLSSLACADMIMGVYCIPMYALSYIPHTSYLVKESGKYACLSWFASIELGGAGGLKSILLLTVDRFIAVAMPLHYRKIVTMRRTGAAICVLWVYVIAMSFVPFLGWNNWREGGDCNFYKTLTPGYVIWASFVTIGVSIIIPLLLNIKIFVNVRKQQKSINQHQHLWSAKQIKRFRERRQSVRITLVLFLLFILFWIPYVLIGPLKYIVNDDDDTTVEKVKVIVQLLYFLNPVINAPIYAFMKTEYKIAYRLLLTTRICQWSTLKHHTLKPPEDNVYPPENMLNNRQRQLTLPRCSAAGTLSTSPGHEDTTVSPTDAVPGLAGPCVTPAQTSGFNTVIVHNVDNDHNVTSEKYQQHNNSPSRNDASLAKINNADSEINSAIHNTTGGNVISRKSINNSQDCGGSSKSSSFSKTETTATIKVDNQGRLHVITVSKIKDNVESPSHGCVHMMTLSTDGEDDNTRQHKCQHYFMYSPNRVSDEEVTEFRGDCESEAASCDSLRRKEDPHTFSTYL